MSKHVEQFKIEQLIPEEETRKTFQKVFDTSTLKTLHQLASKGYLGQVEFTISTGKEAHVFRATDLSGNYRAVKIYKVETSDFRHMSAYIEGDPRFKDVRHDKRSIVFAWAKKEFKNLEKYRQGHVQVPLPLIQKNNVLVMEFIGDKNGAASPPIRQVPFKELDAQNVFRQTMESQARMLATGLVHADLSEYNLLYQNGKVWVIDCGQAVLFSHPNARAFYERDITNLQKYFQKLGVKKTFEELDAQAKTQAKELQHQPL